jgi:hypothetical protein
LSPVNARGFFDLQNKISDSSPLLLPSQGVSSLTWTAGESRAVLFCKSPDFDGRKKTQWKTRKKQEAIFGN